MADEKNTENKPKRKLKTAAERLADAQAEVKRLEQVAKARADKQINELKDRRATLVQQISERQAKVTAIDAELKALGVNTSGPQLVSNG